MAESTIWWLLAGATIVAELVTGTFFLLMLAIGMVAGALAAHAGGSTIVQVVAAAVVGGGAVVVWYFIRKKDPARTPAASNRDVNMDVGETVQVDAWAPDGTATVKYRGAQWTVVLRAGNAPAAGMHRVTEVVGNRLVVDKV
ncbi:MAG TPA: NfeD family protein [Burkholderiaceae bacterium]|nr:NfeD family protein [Burkholderiaceae bacterium]